MGHKDGHFSPVPHGTSAGGHRANPHAGEHHTARCPEGEALGGAPGHEAVEGNTDTLWIDLGGEG